MLREMLGNEIYNAMGHLVRWNNRLRHEDETNAVHAFYTTLYVDMLCRILKESDTPINQALAMRFALRHDMEEAITGDLPRHFKSKEQTGALKRIIRRSARENLTPADYRMWRAVQIGTSREAQVVVLADWLSGLRYMLQEVRLGCKEILSKGIDLLASDARQIKDRCPTCAPFFAEIDSIVEDLVFVYANEERRDDAKNI